VFNASVYLEKVARELRLYSNDSLHASIDMLQVAHQNSRNVYLIGNGGSAGFLAHWEVDWIKGVFLATNKPLNTTSIPSRIGLFTAACNDFSWHEAFQEILRMQANPEDILISVSSSGESLNVIKATKFANDNGLKTISLSGFGDTTLSRISKVALALPSTDMQVIEDCHHVFGHIVLKSFGGECQN